MDTWVLTRRVLACTLVVAVSIMGVPLPSHAGGEEPQPLRAPP